MVRLPTRSTRTDTLFPYTTLFRAGRVVGTLAVGQHRSVERPVIVEVADLRLQIGIELVARTPEQRCARDGALIAGLIVAVDVLRPAIHLAVIDGEIGRAHV